MRPNILGPMVTILERLSRPMIGVPSKVTDPPVVTGPPPPAPTGCKNAYCRLSSGCMCKCFKCTWVCRA